MDTAFVGAAQGRDVPAGTSEEESDEPEPIAARRADALANIAETYMNNNESSGSTADRYQVIVHVGTTVGPRSRLTGAAQGRDPHIEDGPHVPAGEVPLG